MPEGLSYIIKGYGKKKEEKQIPPKKILKHIFIIARQVWFAVANSMFIMDVHAFLYTKRYNIFLLILN